MWQALVQSQVKFNRVPQKAPKEKGQVQQGSGEGSGEGLGGFGAEPGQIQQRSGEGSGVQSQVRFNRVPEKVPQTVWEALVQSQVKFNRVPQKAPKEVGEALVQSQVRFNKVPEKVPEKVWEASVQEARSSSTAFRRRFQSAESGPVQQGSGEGSGESVGGFGAEPKGFRRRFRRRSGRLRCKARLGSTEVRKKIQSRFYDASVQSEVKFDGVPENVLEKVWEDLVQS